MESEKQTVKVSSRIIYNRYCEEEFRKKYKENNIDLNNIILNAKNYYEIIKKFYDRRFLFETSYSSLNENQLKLFWFDNDNFVNQTILDNKDDNIYNFDKINTHNIFIEIFKKDKNIATNLFIIQVNTIIDLLNFLINCKINKYDNFLKDHENRLNKYDFELKKIIEECKTNSNEYNDIIKELNKINESLKSESKVVKKPIKKSLFEIESANMSENDVYNSIKDRFDSLSQLMYEFNSKIKSEKPTLKLESKKVKTFLETIKEEKKGEIEISPKYKSFKYYKESTKDLKDSTKIFETTLKDTINKKKDDYKISETKCKYEIEKIKKKIVMSKKNMNVAKKTIKNLSKEFLKKIKEIKISKKISQTRKLKKKDEMISLYLKYKNNQKESPSISAISIESPSISARTIDNDSISKSLSPKDLSEKKELLFKARTPTDNINRKSNGLDRNPQYLLEKIKKKDTPLKIESLNE